MSKLYIIGNGFDRAHGLKTSYWNFREYLKKYAENFLIEFEKLYGFYPFDPDQFHLTAKQARKANRQRNDDLCDILWESFEKTLGQPDESEIENFCESTVDSMNLESGPIGIEDTLNIYFDKEYRFIEELQEYLLKWTKQIRMHKARVRRSVLKDNHTDMFLSFNYTPTLERIYGIKTDQICHIHGGTPPYCHEPSIIGHGNSDVIAYQREQQKICEENFDEGGASIHKAFADFYRRTFKDTSRYLMVNRTFFDKIHDIDEVLVIGHSLSEVDFPYFKEVLRKVGSAPWSVFYFNPGCQAEMKEALRKIGFRNNQYQLLSSETDFWDA